MTVQILSRRALEALIEEGFPENTAVISFCSPAKGGKSEELPPALTGVCPLFSVQIPDIDIEVLERFGYTYDSYLAEAGELAAFIYEVKEKGLKLICQCDYGQSRSAACAAAILEHFEKNGISVFKDYRYYPNQLVFNKVFDALESKSA